MRTLQNVTTMMHLITAPTVSVKHLVNFPKNIEESQLRSSVKFSLG
jgi:hypothetical protein